MNNRKYVNHYNVIKKVDLILTIDLLPINKFLFFPATEFGWSF